MKILPKIDTLFCFFPIKSARSEPFVCYELFTGADVVNDKTEDVGSQVMRKLCDQS